MQGRVIGLQTCPIQARASHLIPGHLNAFLLIERLVHRFEGATSKHLLPLAQRPAARTLVQATSSGPQRSAQQCVLPITFMQPATGPAPGSISFLRDPSPPQPAPVRPQTRSLQPCSPSHCLTTAYTDRRGSSRPQTSARAGATATAAAWLRCLPCCRPLNNACCLPYAATQKVCWFLPRPGNPPLAEGGQALRPGILLNWTVRASLPLGSSHKGWGKRGQVLSKPCP